MTGEISALSSILSSYLDPNQRLQPDNLAALCLRRAAVYATTSLYKYHLLTTSTHTDGSAAVNESLWEDVFPALDSHFLRLIPQHLYEEFLDNVLCALDFVSHLGPTGKPLMQYVVLFFPKSLARFRAKRRFKDRVMVPTVCCLNRCIHLEELYLEMADSPAVTPYLLSHILKSLPQLKVIALPKQCDDDVLSVVGMNCPNLESVVLTGGGVGITDLGLAWLMCSKKLCSVVLNGNLPNVTPNGVALLLKGVPGLQHLVYDGLHEVLNLISFNSSELNRFRLRSILGSFGQNHLEMITKMCPEVEWLSLDTNLCHNLSGLEDFGQLKLFHLNYRQRPLDATVFEFFRLNGAQLTALHLVQVRALTMDDLAATVGQCPSLEILSLDTCLIDVHSRSKQAMSLSSVEHLQLFNVRVESQTKLLNFMGLFWNLRVLDMDKCPLDLQHLKAFLQSRQDLKVLRCPKWTKVTHQDLDRLNVRHNIQYRYFSLSEHEQRERYKETKAASLLSHYAGISPVRPIT